MINRPSNVSSLGAYFKYRIVLDTQRISILGAAKDLEIPTGLHDLGYDDVVRKGKLRVTLHR